MTEERPIVVSADRELLYRDRIVARKGAFSRAWAERMREDIMSAFTAPRGPTSWSLSGSIDHIWSLRQWLGS